MTPTELAIVFTEAINAQDIEMMLKLMTDDHLFIDSRGNRIFGKDFTRTAWEDYFRMFPDYNIQVHESAETGSVALLSGVASGTYAPDGHFNDENEWMMLTAWRARVEGDRIHEWQIYGDGKPVYEIMERYEDMRE